MESCYLSNALGHRVNALSCEAQTVYHNLGDIASRCLNIGGICLENSLDVGLNGICHSEKRQIQALVRDTCECPDSFFRIFKYNFG